MDDRPVPRCKPVCDPIDLITKDLAMCEECLTVWHYRTVTQVDPQTGLAVVTEEVWASS